MCIIAGYTGEKRAAPILIDMLKKTEYIDGGLSTGIATIHEGKLYMRKVVGDVDTLLRETDALDLPGTTGIIHSRTGGDHVECAHPFLSDDGELALVSNGTSWGCANLEFMEAQNKRMNDFYDRGMKIRSAVKKIEPAPGQRYIKTGYAYHVAEPYALIVGDKLKDCDNADMRDGMADAMREALEEFPVDVINLALHARLPETITVCTVTRPMAIGIGKGEVYMCTAPFGLPENVTRGSVFFTPPTTVLQVTPKGVAIRSTEFADTRVEQLNFRTAKEVRTRLEGLLKVGEENAIDLYDIPFYTEWDSIWSKPMVDSKYVLENSRLKPVGPALYEGLWSFYKEGRLRMKLGTRTTFSGKESKIMKFWLDH